MCSKDRVNRFLFKFIVIESYLLHIRSPKDGKLWRNMLKCFGSLRGITLTSDLSNSVISRSCIPLVKASSVQYTTSPYSEFPDSLPHVLYGVLLQWMAWLVNSKLHTLIDSIEILCSGEMFRLGRLREV